MNGRFTTDATGTQGAGLLASALKAANLDAATGRPPSHLGAVANDQRLDTAGRVEALFLATLSRRATAEESAKFVRYVESGCPAKDPKRALADVFWALLNCSEFVVNH
jgi:hypothetical protein